MHSTQFYGNTFLFINKNAEEFPLPKESKEVDLTMYYEEMEKPLNDTRKQYRCDFINKDGSEASLCGNVLFRLMEQEGVGHYVFHTISGLYDGWNNENEIGLLMKKAKITNTKTMFPERFVVNVGNLHQVYFCVNDFIYSESLKKVKNIPEKYNTHIVFNKLGNTFEVRCFEKGVGETQACGSGAYAVGIVMIRHFNLSEVNIIMKGGKYIVKEGFLIVKKLTQEQLNEHKLRLENFSFNND